MPNEITRVIQCMLAMQRYPWEQGVCAQALLEVTPAPIPPATEQTLAKTALTVFHALGLRAYSRADFILDEAGDLWFLEINTLPGMTPTSLVPQEAEAVGISYGELCEKIIEIALREV